MAKLLLSQSKTHTKLSARTTQARLVEQVVKSTVGDCLGSATWSSATRSAGQELIGTAPACTLGAFIPRQTLSTKPSSIVDLDAGVWKSTMLPGLVQENRMGREPSPMRPNDFHASNSSLESRIMMYDDVLWITINSMDYYGGFCLFCMRYIAVLHQECLCQ